MLAWAIVPGFVDLCTSLPVLRGNLTWDRHSSNVKMLLALYLIPLCPANSCIPVRRATECSVCPLFDRENLRDVSRHGAADSAVREQQQLGRRELSHAITYQHDSWDTSHTCLKTRDDSIASTPNFSWDQERHNGSLPHGCDKRIQGRNIQKKKK